MSGLLQVMNLSKHFGKVKALNNASLRLMPGEIRALLGSNGSGKSTMAKILGGLFVKNSGDISINGENVEINSPLDSHKYGISIAYQDLSLIPQLTIKDNVSLGRELRTKKLRFIDEKEIEEETKVLMDKLKIKSSPNVIVETLDQSTKSLIEVIKALAWNPKILILDEVTASLHRDQVEHLFDLLRLLKKDGTSILMITHRFDEVFNICDTATILRNGQTVTEVNINEVDEDDLVFYMTGKRPEGNIRNLQANDKNEENKKEILSVSNLKIKSKVNGVSLTVNSGEIVGICGLQGQGQSEFLRAIFGAISYDSGSISYLGKKVKFKTPKEAIKCGIGFISGDREYEGIFPDRSIIENIFISKTALGRLTKFINMRKYTTKTNEIVEQLKIVTGGINQPANSLSGGNQQKLTLGRNLILDLKLLILDDPTKGVDINARREIHHVLRNMTTLGNAVLISSSDHEELLELCDRIVVFYEGRITAEFKVDKNTEEKLISAMLGVKCDKEGSVST